jgi:hypothetical protein
VEPDNNEGTGAGNPDRELGISPEHQSVSFAWQAHEAVQGWIESVDVKTSIVLVAEIAVTGAAAGSLLFNNGELHQATGLHLDVAIAALVTLAGAVASALWVVFPRLGSRKQHAEDGGDDIIYFGHLRHHMADDIVGILKRLTPEDERRQLARQLHIIGEVAWRKHVWLRWSIALLAIGSILFALSLVAFDVEKEDHRVQPIKVQLIK